MTKKLDLSVYLIIDPEMCGGNELALNVALEAVKSGVSIIQLRAPNYKKRALYDLAIQLKQICDQYNIVFIINDHIDVALAVNADGVHIGQEDLPVIEARRLLGDDKIIGLSVSTIDEVRIANKLPINYVGIGAIYATSTKPEKDAIGFTLATELVKQINVPAVLIGGLQLTHIPLVKKANAAGICVVSAICKAKNVPELVNQFKELWYN